jgi:hypothetical protein
VSCYVVRFLIFLYFSPLDYVAAGPFPPFVSPPDMCCISGTMWVKDGLVGVDRLLGPWLGGWSHMGLQVVFVVVWGGSGFVCFVGFAWRSYS